MIPPLEELLARVSAETVMAQELSIATALDLPATAWQPISIGREILYINAQLVSNFSIATQEGAAAGGFLSYAKGGWLTLCAYEIFDTTRIDSSSATGVIRLNNDGANPFTFGVGAVRVLNETAQKTYTNQVGGTVPAGGFLDTVTFVADEPGTASNLSSADVLSLVATVPDVTPVFYENLIGQDEETPEALKVRAREANAKASPNGPGDAYQYYAKSTLRPDGSNVGVTRTNKVEGNGTVTLYLADADGALTSQDREYVFDNVNLSVVPTGFTLVIPTPSCIEEPINLVYELTPNPDSAASHEQTESAVEAAVALYLSTIPIGGDKAQSFKGVYRSTLNQVMRNAAGGAVLNLVLTSPAADVALTSGQAPVLGVTTPTWDS